MGKFDTPPPFLEKGSDHLAVNGLFEFLSRWASERKLGPTKLVLDKKLGKNGVYWLKEYQRDRGLEIDGGCGPLTRAKLKEDGFDFDACARDAKELGVFVQPGDVWLYWMPGMEATPDLRLACQRVHQVLHGCK